MLIHKPDLPQVSEPFMNTVHNEDVDLINTLYDTLQHHKSATATTAEVITAFEQWITHTVAHFKGEEDKMLQLSFPPYPVHKAEHDRCLETMRAVLTRFKHDGNSQACTQYLEFEVVPWLIQHINTMDTVTSQFFTTSANL
jgi:hemerythrin